MLSLVSGLDPARGGTAAAATSMVLAAHYAGADCVVVVPDHGGAEGSLFYIHRLRRAGVVVHALPTLRWPRIAAYRWGISAAQLRWVRRHIGEFDVVHVHGVWGIGPLSGLTVGRLAGKAVVVTAHESLTAFDINSSRSRARRRQKVGLKALYLKFATMFTFTSQLEAADSLSQWMPHRIIYLPVQDPTPDISARRRAVSEELRVAFVGRIHPKKNLGLLIEALAELPSHVRLAVAGEGPPSILAGLRERAHALGVSDRLDWLGFVEPTDRAALFDRSDLLAMPSVFECFGLAAAEAMLHGVPVLVSERTGIAEVVKRSGGGRVTLADTGSIVAAIRELDGDRTSLTAMGQRGQAAVQRELNYTQAGEALCAVYTEAVELSPK